MESKFINALVANANVNAINAAETIGPNDRVNLITLPADSTYAVTLPKASEASGIYTFEVVAQADGSPGTVTVQDQDETADPYTSTAMTAIDGYLVLMCNGRSWFELAFSAT
jgi:hypothetical protein